MQKSFTKVILLIISYVFIFFGISHLLFPKEIALFVMYGVNGDIATLLQQFLGASYILISIFLYLLKETKGKPFYITIGALNITGFIHLYLIFLFDNILQLPNLYFILIILIQICLFMSLFAEIKKK